MLPIGKWKEEKFSRAAFKVYTCLVKLERNFIILESCLKLLWHAFWNIELCHWRCWRVGWVAVSSYSRSERLAGSTWLEVEMAEGLVSRDCRARLDNRQNLATMALEQLWYRGTEGITAFTNIFRLLLSWSESVWKPKALSFKAFFLCNQW